MFQELCCTLENVFLQTYLGVVQERLPVVDASSTSTPPVHLLLPAVRQRPAPAVSPPPLLPLTLPEPSLPVVTPLLGRGRVLPRGPCVVAMEMGRGRRAGGGGRRRPRPVAAHLPPVRTQPQQRQRHQAANHHIGEVTAEVFQVHPEGGSQDVYIRNGTFNHFNL